MERTRDTFFKVSIILSMIFTIMWAIVSGILVIAGTICLIGGIAAATNGEPGLIGSAIVCFVWSFILVGALICSCINITVNKRASVEHTKELYILTIVFSALSGTEFGIAAAILGLIMLNREEKNDEEKPNDTEEFE